MFTSTLDPVLFSIGPLSIRWYSLAYILGFLGLLWLLLNYSKNKKIELNKEEVYDFVFWMMIGVVLGGRLGEVLFWNPSYYFSNPLEILKVWHGGMSFHGGLIGGVIACYFFCRKKKISFWKMADIVVIPAMFFWALGRLANFVNGELYGPVTSVSWCVNFPNVEGCRHPYQIYAFLEQMVIGFFLVFLYSKEKVRKKEGLLFWTFIMLAGLGRFVVDFWRVDEAMIWLLSVGQWLSLVMFVIGLVFVVRLLRRKKEK